MTEIESLKRIGATAIQEKTHIAMRNIELILEEDFEKIPRIQFMGFLTIIEREFELDLSKLREAYEDTASASEERAEPEVINAQSDRKPRWPLYVAIVLLLGTALAFLYVLLPGSNEDETAGTINMEAIEQAQEALQSSAMQRAEAAAPTPLKEEPVLEIPEMREPEEVRFIPKQKIWIGMIALPDFKKVQKLTSDNVELNTSMEWLIMLGHGYVQIAEGNETHDYSDRNKLFFHYDANKTLRQIRKAEFVERNRGRTW